jgi:hypothetical protein
MAITRRFLWTPAATPEGLFTIVLPFDPREIFGKARAPVVVTINGYSYRSTIAHMGGPPFVPFRQSHRDAAKVKTGGAIEVELALDEAVRTVDLPGDLAAALDGIAGARAAWDALSYTARREHAEAIEGAKRPETRAGRLQAAIAFVSERIKD